jgi:methyltransferase (TIGR00027 family)
VTPVTHVSDTARWVAFYRAMESERADAIFRDPFARRLAGPEGERIVHDLPKGRQMAWPMIVRTAVMDDIILRAVARDGVDTVLNLAAGLDARPYRLPLPPTLRWFDVDLPDMISYKREQLAGERPACALESVALDLADRPARQALFERVGAGAKTTLVMTEGLLVYLKADDVADLARDLHAHRTFRWWLLDLASPGLLKMLERSWGPVLRAGNAPFQFGPAQGTAFFQPFGWREIEYRSMWEEARRLRRRMRFAALWDVVGRLAPRHKREEFRRFSGIALLERS